MRSRLLVLIVLLALLSAPSSARADMAPPEPPPGSNMQPGAETTQVRMQAETVLIEVLPGGSDKGPGRARVTADFTMHNTGNVSESMAARFPISANDGWGTLNFINDLRILAAGHAIPTRRIMGEDPNQPWSSDKVPWAEFDVTFPAQQDVSVRAQYTVQGGGGTPLSWFTYILSTGAGWKDTIGSADIVVALPYEASEENVVLNASPPNARFDGHSVRWHYDDLEPTLRDNFRVTLVTPATWQRFLAAEDNVALHPTDGESWGRLGLLCKQMAFAQLGKMPRLSYDQPDPGADQLYQCALRAYDQAVTLLPKDALWHAGYADLLGFHAYYGGFAGMNTDQEVARSLSEIQIAQQLAPNDPQVQEIATNIAFTFPGGRTVRQWLAELTATAAAEIPTAWPTSTPRSTAIAPPSPTIAPIAQATAAPTPKPAATPCASALLIPLALLALAVRRR